MANKIKLFKFVQRGYQTMGIYSFQSNRNRMPNAKKLYFSLSMLQLLASTTVLIVCDINSIDEFANALFTCSSSLCALVTYSVIVWKAPHIFKLIEHFEEFVEKRKHNTDAL